MIKANRASVTRGLGALLAALIVGACADDVPTGTDGVPVISSFTIDANPTNVISAVVRVRSTGNGTVYVEFGTDTTFSERTPARALVGDTAVLPVLALAPSTHYNVRVVSVSSTGQRAVSPAHPFTTGALPADIPPFTVTSPGTPSPGYVLFGFTGALSLGGFYALIVDNTGRVVWYRKFDSQITDCQLQPNGNITVYSSIGSGERRYYELDMLGTVVAEHAAANDLETDSHEYRNTPAGEVIYGVLDTVMNLTAIGGRADVKVRDFMIEYRRPGGKTLHWRASEHMTVDEGAADVVLNGAQVNPWHCNAIDIDADGNLLASFRNSDEILKIDATSGDVIWRLGGKKNQFQFIGDPLNGTSHQHGIRRLANGNIILFDNGNLHPTGESRAVEYRLDEQAHTAQLVWEYRHQPALSATALGFAQRIADGHTLVCFGTAQHLSEVDAAGRLQWELRVDNTTHLIYRAFRIASLY